VLLAPIGGVPGFISIPLPKSFRSMSIWKVTPQTNVTTTFLQNVKLNSVRVAYVCITLLVGGCIMLWLGPMRPRYGWEMGGCRLMLGGCACGGVGGSARRGWPPLEPKFDSDSWELDRGTVTWREIKMLHTNNSKSLMRKPCCFSV